MREIPKMIASLLFIALLMAHFFLVALFIAPSDKLLALVIQGRDGFLKTSELPELVQAFLTINKVPVEGDYRPASSLKADLIMGILNTRERLIMNDSERLVLNMNLLDYGEGIVGIGEASEYYYKKPLEELSDKEWVTLINLQEIFSKK